MRACFKSLVAVLACLYLGGAHLAVLQVVAWTGMMVVYSGQDGLKSGVAETFSGEKPCPLCKVIAKAKSQDLPENNQAPGPDKGAAKLLKELVPMDERKFPGPSGHDADRLGFAEPPRLLGLAGARPLLPPPRHLA